jgi:AsmA protein
MTGKADRRRPLVFAIVLIATITAALVAPVVIGARLGKPFAGTEVRADSRDSVVISEPLTISSAQSVTIERGTVALAGPSDGASRVTALLRTLVMGSGADLVLDGARVVIDRRTTPPAADSTSSISSSPPSGTLATASALAGGELAPVVAALSGFKFRSLSVLNTTVLLRTAHGTTEKFSNVNLEIAPQRHGLVNAKGRIDYRGEPLDVDFTFTPPHADGAAAPVQVKAAIKGKYIDATFHGRLASGERGITAPNAELSVPDLRAAASWLGVSWPAGPGLGLFTAKGTLTLDERMISFEHANFTLDGNAATGALIAKLGHERASVEGTLAFANLDIAPYSAQSRPYALALASDWVSWIRAPGVASLAFLRDADADIRISAGNVMNGADRLGRVAASLSVKDGKAYGEIAELELDEGGTGEGQFTVDVTGSQPQFTVHAALSDIELSTLAAPRLGPAAVEGSGDIRLDVTANGESESEILRSLAGTVSVEMVEGGRIGLDLAALPQVADTAAPAERWGAAAQGSTSISKLTARFKAENGVLSTETVEAAAGDRSLTATGSIDLEQNALDLLLSVVTGPAASDTAQAARTTGAYRIRGPWSAPTISRADPGKAAAQTLVPAADPG